MFEDAWESFLSNEFISITIIIILFLVQITICLMFEETLSKLIPVLLILLLLILSGISSTGSGWGGLILALLFITIMIPSTIGIIAAWIIYGIITVIRRKK